MTDPIREWAERYEGELDRRAPARSVPAQRARLIMAYRAPRPRSFLRLPQLAIAGTVIAATALGFALMSEGDGRFSAPNQSEHGEAGLPSVGGVAVDAGTVISAEGEQKGLEFPQGSRAIWKKNSKGALFSYSKNLVELSLESGSLEMEVKHQPGRRWVVRAGDFRVYVVGTAFSVNYEALTGALDVQVARGSVRVEGPHTETKALTLTRGERFTWTPDKGQGADAQGQVEPSDDGARGSDSPPAKSSDKKVGAEASPAWQELARAGKFESALAKVERIGVDRVVATSTVDDRVLLGNAARYMGRGDLALRAYRAARSSPGPQATLAAYYLAKTSLDSHGNQTQAIKWLRTYLAEAPRGDLSASARARLMTLLESSGDRTGAEKLAREYVALHPHGPHLQVARRLAKGPAD